MSLPLRAPESRRRTAPNAPPRPRDPTDSRVDLHTAALWRVNNESSRDYLTLPQILTIRTPATQPLSG